MATSSVFYRHDGCQTRATFTTVIAETDLTHDHQWAKRKFCQIVRRWYSGIADNHEPAIFVLDDSAFYGANLHVRLRHQVCPQRSVEYSHCSGCLPTGISVCFYELVLPLVTKFKHCSLQRFLKPHNFGCQLRAAFPLCVELAMNVEPTAFAGVDDMHQAPSRNAAKMTGSLRATVVVFVTWIVTKLHVIHQTGMTPKYQRLAVKSCSNSDKFRSGD